MELKSNIEQVNIPKDELSHGAEFRYNLQSWIEGEIDYRDFEKLIEAGEISKKEVHLIGLVKNDTLEYIANIVITAYIDTFKEMYKHSLVQDDFLEDHIKRREAILAKFKEERQHIVNDLISIPRLRKSKYFNITVEDVINYLHRKLDNAPLEVIQKEYGAVALFERPHLFYVVYSNYLKWLKWFKRQEELINTSPILKTDNFKWDTKPTQREVLKDSIISYTWLNNPDSELPELHQLLLDNSLIHPDTTLEQIKAVFTAKPLHTITNPIKWYNNNASGLLYFIQQLEGLDGSLIKKRERANYQRLKACFVKPDGKPFTENFRQAKQNLKQYGLSPKQQQIIDTIIKQFY